MSGWVALVPPRKGTRDKAGMCLRYVQSFFGAPARHRSAWHAWLAQEHRHGVGTPLPSVPVLLWFSHFGSYDDGLGPYDGVPVGGRANWGHVAALVPGDGIYTSPASGVGFGRYATIAEIEAVFNARYVGWSEDINWLRVARPGSQVDPKEFIMPALIRNHDGSIGFVSDAGTLDAISSMREVDSLKMSGLVGGWVQMKDGTVWNALVERTARLRAQQASVDPKRLAAEVAALMVGPVVAALSEAGQLTQADVEAAVERVTKELLAKAAA